MATPHVTDDLVMLLTGELDRDATRTVVQHLRHCQSCSEELLDAVAANAALRSAVGVENFALEADDGPIDDGPIDDLALPPLAAFGPRPKEPAPRTGRPHRGWIAAAAALVVVGGVTAGVLTSLQHSAPVVATTALHPLTGPSTASGKVVVTANHDLRQMTVVSTGLAPPAKGDFYEVWLLQPATNKMLAVGELSPSSASHFVVSSSLMAGYSAVDVSLQSNDGDPAHSKISVLRGYF